MSVTEIYFLDAFIQMYNKPAELFGYLSLIVVSIAFFNFFGLTVTQNLSGASRATVDACRTILVWIYSSAAGWEEICFRRLMLQVSGFIFLVIKLRMWLPE